MQASMFKNAINQCRSYMKTNGIGVSSCQRSVLFWSKERSAHSSTRSSLIPDYLPIPEWLGKDSVSKNQSATADLAVCFNYKPKPEPGLMPSMSHLDSDGWCDMLLHDAHYFVQPHTRSVPEWKQQSASLNTHIKAVDRLLNKANDKGGAKSSTCLAHAKTVLLVRAIGAALQEQKAFEKTPTILSDFDRAAKVLNYIKNCDLKNEIIKPMQPHKMHEQGFSEVDVGLAWRAMAKLGSTAYGFHILQQLSAHLDNSQVDKNQSQKIGHPSAGGLDESVLLKVALRAAKDLIAKIDAGVGTSSDNVKPCAVDLHALCENIKSKKEGALTPTEKALLAAQEKLARPETTLHAEQNLAIAMVRNGFLNDDAQSLWHKAEARVQKLDQWIERAIPAKKSLWKKLAPFKNKSPFNALLKFRKQCALRSDFGTAQHTRVGQQRAMLDSVLLLHDRLESAIRDKRTPDLTTAARLVALSYWKPFLFRMTHGDSIDPIELQKHIEGLKKNPLFKSGAISLAAGNATDAQLKSAIEKENRNLTPEWLRSIANDILDNPPDQELFSKNLDRIEKNALRAINIGNDFSKKNLARGLVEQLNDMEIGSRISLSSGGIVGVGLKGMTGTVSRFFSAFALRGRANVSIEASRRAVFELSMTSHGTELFIGTEKPRSRGVGLGIFGGIDAHVVTAGGGSDYTYLNDPTRLCGVTLRLDRNGARNDDVVKKNFSKIIEDLLANKKSGRGESILKNLVTKYPDLSVNYVNNVSRSKRHVTSGNLTATVNMGGPRLGASVNVTYESSTKKRAIREETGLLQIDRNANEYATKVNATLGGMLSAGINLIETNAATANLGVLGTLAGDSSVDLYRKSVEVKSTLIFKDGTVSPASYRQIVYGTFEQFRAGVSQDIDSWTETAAKLHFQKSYESDVPGHKREALKNGRRLIARFFADTKADLQPNSLYTKLFKLRPDAAEKINMFKSLATLAENSNDLSSFERYNKAIMQIRDAAESWTNFMLVCSDRSWKEDQTRLAAVVKYGSFNRKEESRIKLV